MDVKCTSRNVFIKRYIQFTLNRNSVTLGYVPDICKLLCTFGLQTFINDVLVSPNNLPTKYQWKKLVKHLVNTRETELWNRRTLSDEDFSYFRMLHPVISPTVIYKVLDKNRDKHIELFVAKLWTRTYTTISQCTHCSQMCLLGEEVHLVYDCSATEQ